MDPLNSNQPTDPNAPAMPAAGPPTDPTSGVMNSGVPGDPNLAAQQPPSDPAAPQQPPAPAPGPVQAPGTMPTPPTAAPAAHHGGLPIPLLVGVAVVLILVIGALIFL